MSVCHDKTEGESMEKLTPPLPVLSFSWLCCSVGPCCGLCVGMSCTASCRGRASWLGFYRLTACGHVSSSSCLRETINAKFLAWRWKWRGISPIHHPWGRLPVPGRQIHTGKIHFPLFSTLMILTVNLFLFPLPFFWGGCPYGPTSFFREEISLGYLHIFIIWSF